MSEATIRELEPGDGPAILRFAAAVPAHDLLFLAHDIRNERVVSAWLAAAAGDTMPSLVATDGEQVVATAALLADPLGWSPHVAEVRLLVAPEWRGRGLGRQLLDRCIVLAGERGAAKLVAYMTPDQRGAITLFEEAGFRAEALLRDHVRDADGALHDLVLLSLDRGRAERMAEAYR